MLADGLKLSVYLGERDRAGEGLLADALMDGFAAAGVRAGALLRGVEGFGIRHRLQTERLLTLSEDLPAVAVAVDRPARIEALLEHVRGLGGHGLITLERVALADGAVPASLPSPQGESLKIAIFGTRGARAGGGPAHVAAVELLHRHGAAGASVTLGVDGAVRGRRLRARFLARNPDVPVLIEAVGSHSAITGALPELARLFEDPLMTIERALICKRDGVLLAEPGLAAESDPAGLAYWQKLVVQTGEQPSGGQGEIHSTLVRRLRREGAAGATSLRAQWGYSGAHRPHGERLLALGRRVPVLTVVLDTPANMRGWFAIVDEMTARTGLVTSEIVPALRASGPGIAHGGLSLAAPVAGPQSRRRQSR
jgi:PII-like signaling protein